MSTTTLDSFVSESDVYKERIIITGSTNTLIYLSQLFNRPSKQISSKIESKKESSKALIIEPKIIKKTFDKDFEIKRPIKNCQDVKTKNKVGFWKSLEQKFSNHLAKKYMNLNHGLERMVEKMEDGSLKVKNAEEDYNFFKKLCDGLIYADEKLEVIDYFNNEIFKKEVKKFLENSYIMEAEFRKMTFKNKREKRITDFDNDLITALADKSKSSLTNTIYATTKRSSRG